MKAFAKVQKQKVRSYQQERKIIEVIVKSGQQKPQVRKKALKQPISNSLRQHVINYKVKSQLPFHTLEKKVPFPVKISKNNQQNFKIADSKSQSQDKSDVQIYAQEVSIVQNNQKKLNTFKSIAEYQGYQQQKNSANLTQNHNIHKVKGDKIHFKHKKIDQAQDVCLQSQNQNIKFDQDESEFNPQQIINIQQFLQTQNIEFTKPIESKLKRSFKPTQTKWNCPNQRTQQLQNSIEMEIFQFDYRTPFSF